MNAVRRLQCPDVLCLPCRTPSGASSDSDSDDGFSSPDEDFNKPTRPMSAMQPRRRSLLEAEAKESRRRKGMTTASLAEARRPAVKAAGPGAGAGTGTGKGSGSGAGTSSDAGANAGKPLAKSGPPALGGVKVSLLSAIRGFKKDALKTADADALTRSRMTPAGSSCGAMPVPSPPPKRNASGQLRPAAKPVSLLDDIKAAAQRRRGQQSQ